MTKYGRTSLEQIYTIIEYLENYPELTGNRRRTKEGASAAARLWSEIAKKVNGLGGGRHRSPKTWQKYLNDYKCRVMKHVARNKRFGEGEGGIKLMPVEKRLASLFCRKQNITSNNADDPLHDDEPMANSNNLPQSPQSSPGWPDDSQTDQDHEIEHSSNNEASLTTDKLDAAWQAVERQSSALLRSAAAMDRLAAAVALMVERSTNSNI